MSVSKLSQIAVASAPPVSGTQFVAVTNGNTDNLYTIDQIEQVTASFKRLTGPLTLYVRTVPIVVTLSNASPCVATWASTHGLQVGDPVVFSSPYDRGICTITIASPGVVTFNNHGYALNDPVSFDTTGALPTGLAINTIYYVVNPTFNTFQVAATPSGAAINTSGSQSGVQYAWRNNSFPSGVIDGSIYFVKSVVDSFNITFSKTLNGTAINTTTAQVGKIIGQTGNDSNDGLSQTRTGALMTVGQAWTRICGFYNLNAQIVTVQCAHGTYYGGGFNNPNTSGDTDNSPVFCSNTLDAAVAAFWIGAGEVLFLGDASNPDAVRWLSSFGAIDTNCDFDGNLTFKGLRLEFNFGFNGAGVDYFQTLGFNTIILDTIIFGSVYGATASSGIRMQIQEGTCQLVNPCQVLANGFPSGELISVFGSGTWFKNDNISGPIIGVNNPAFFDIFQASDNGFIQSQLTEFDGLWTYNTIASIDGQGFVFNHLGNNPLPVPTGGAQVNDRGFYFEFTSPTSQSAAQFGSPGCSVDIFFFRFVPITGFTQVLNNSQGHVIIDPAGVLANGTIQMSPNPTNGQMVNIRTSQTITAMTFSPNAGQSVVGAPTTLNAGQKVEAIYRSANNTWYFSN